MAKTIRQMVDDVHGVIVAEGLDLSPHDVGHIIGLFLDGMAEVDPAHAGVNDFLRTVADECESVTDE